MPEMEAWAMGLAPGGSIDCFWMRPMISVRVSMLFCRARSSPVRPARGAYTRAVATMTIPIQYFLIHCAILRPVFSPPL